MSTPYHEWIRDLEGWWQRGAQLPCGGFAPCARPPLAPDAPCALYFAPHPDDESIIGALALRLFREADERRNVARPGSRSCARPVRSWGTNWS